MFLQENKDNKSEKSAPSYSYKFKYIYSYVLLKQLGVARHGLLLQTAMHTGWGHARISIIRTVALRHGISCSAGMFHGGDDSEEKELISNNITSTLQRPTRVGK